MPSSLSNALTASCFWSSLNVGSGPPAVSVPSESFLGRGNGGVGVGLGITLGSKVLKIVGSSDGIVTGVAVGIVLRVGSSKNVGVGSPAEVTGF